jgi:hypothetical protein
MSYHHPFSPSSLKRLKLCPGSFKLCQNLEQITSEYAQDGTEIHDALEHDNFSTLKPAQLKCAEEMRYYVNSFIPFEKTQKEIKISVLNDFELLTEGTADVVYVEKDIVYAFDYKAGFLAVDKVKDNMQAKAYSLGLMQKYNKPVQFHFVQPRINFFDSYTFQLSEKQTILEEIKTTINDCNTDKMVLNPGESQCKYCLAKQYDTCPALKFAYKSHGAELANIEHTSELSIPHLKSNYDKWLILKQIGANLENTIKFKLQQGEEIQGLKLKSRGGGRECNDIQELYNEIQDIIPVNEFLDCCKISISQLENIYGRKIKKEMQDKGTKVTLKEANNHFKEKTKQFINKKSDVYYLTQEK